MTKSLSSKQPTAVRPTPLTSTRGGTARATAVIGSNRSGAGIAAASLIVAFLTVAHLPILPERLRIQLMVGLVGVAAVATFFRQRKLLGTPTITLVGTAVVVQVAVLFANFTSPALTPYAENKRILFFAVFSVCFVLFPLLLATTRHGVDRLINLLVLMSLFFAALAYTTPTGENLRRSGIELNPLLLAKLLYFPGFLLLARSGARANRAKTRSRHSRTSDPGGHRVGSDTAAHSNTALMLFALFGIMASLQTASRSPIVVFGLLYLIDQLVAFSERRLRYLPIVVITALTGVVGYLSVAPSYVRERFTVGSVAAQTDDGSRVYMMTLASEHIASNFTTKFFGIGLGNFSTLFWLNAPHNILLEAVLELGAIGSLPLLFLLGWALTISVRVLRSRDVTMRFTSLWFLYFLMMSLVGGELTFPSMLLYLPAGILIYGSVAGQGRAKLRGRKHVNASEAVYSGQPVRPLAPA